MNTYRLGTFISRQASAHSLFFSQAHPRLQTSNGKIHFSISSLESIHAELHLEMKSTYVVFIDEFPSSVLEFKYLFDSMMR